MKVACAELLCAPVTERTKWLFLSIVDEAGVSGWGECSLSGGERDVVAVADHALPDIVGDVLTPQNLLDRLDTSTLPAAALGSAVCQAAWDIFAQHASVPLSKALGGPETAGVPLYANVNRRNRDRLPETMAESALLAKAAGFKAIKIAPFDEVTSDLSGPAVEAAMSHGFDRIAAVRNAIGPDARLMIDCHWRFNPVSSDAMIREAAVFDPWWIECPILETANSVADIVGLRHIANDLGIRLAGLENCIRVDGFRRWIDAEAYDVMMPDVKYAGGPEEMLRIADAMSARGITFSPHNPNGPISHLHSVHICAAHGAADLLENQFDETPYFESIVEPCLPRQEGGSFMLRSTAGLGSGIERSAMPFEVLVSFGGSRS